MAPVAAFVHEPDGAVIRAGLVADLAADLGATLVDPTIAYHDRMHVVRGDEVLDVWPVDLRGW